MTGTSPLPSWPKLCHLACTHNSFTAMDASLRLAPALRTLSLCSNNIRGLASLDRATSLTELRLSHNCLTSVATIAHCPGTLQVLHLQVCVCGRRVGVGGGGGAMCVYMCAEDQPALQFRIQNLLLSHQ